jgi:hypothetical protein
LDRPKAEYARTILESSRHGEGRPLLQELRRCNLAEISPCTTVGLHIDYDACFIVQVGLGSKFKSREGLGRRRLRGRGAAAGGRAGDVCVREERAEVEGARYGGADRVISLANMSDPLLEKEPRKDPIGSLRFSFVSLIPDHGQIDIWAGCLCRTWR